MSIIFQLFSADDLRDDVKRRIIYDTVWNSNFNTAIDIRVNTLLDPSPLVAAANKQLIVEKILQRASQVFTQLVPGEHLNQPRTFNDLDLSQRLYPQILSDADLNRLGSRERDIFEKAISCEVTHFNFYVRLLTLRDTVYKAYQASTGQQLEGHPDTDYSPFNPNSPLHEIYPYP